METIVTNANRAERDKEALRLSKLTERDVGFRAVECECDYWKFCSKCDGSGGYHEAFYLLCSHRVFDGDDVECAESGCAERERLRSLAIQRADASSYFAPLGRYWRMDGDYQ